LLESIKESPAVGAFSDFWWQSFAFPARSFDLVVIAYPCSTAISASVLPVTREREREGEKENEGGRERERERQKRERERVTEREKERIAYPCHATVSAPVLSVTKYRGNERERKRGKEGGKRKSQIPVPPQSLHL